jgi:hypothetical protein
MVSTNNMAAAAAGSVNRMKTSLSDRCRGNECPRHPAEPIDSALAHMQMQ